MTAAASRKTTLDVAEELVAITHPASLEADQYSSLRHRIETIRCSSGGTTVAVTSAGPDEGKTVTALNLAAVLAQSPRARILIIDADLRRPSVARYLRLIDADIPGVADAVAADRIELGQFVRRIDALNVSVLPAGHARERTYDLLGSKGFATLVEQARSAYDVIVVDAPPLLPLADARVLERWVDGVILVVAAHRTPKGMVEEALRLVDPSKLAAVALNGDDRPLSPYYRYYGAGHARRA